MNHLFYLLIISCVSLFSFQCKAPSAAIGQISQTGEMYLTNKNKITFASLELGKEQIIRDEVENYFKDVKELDMRIQMNSISRGDRETLLKDYKLHLQNSVLPWTEEEKKFVSDVFIKATQYVTAISGEILPDNITLIKCNMNHYGEGVFYTREKAIIIPLNTLQKQDAYDFLQTMLHEIFHIYSRYNPKKRDKLYTRIGYKAIAAPKFPEVIESRILLNPDGVNYNYAIDLKDKTTSKPVTAIPIIYSKMLNFSPKQTDFFEYLQFSLFAVEDGEVQTTRNGESTIAIKNLDGFYEQIGSNTEYIIHPDEVLADNFTLICLSNDNPDILKNDFNIREEGKKLIEDLKAIIRQ
jgi:hypothetical protein